MKAVVLAPFAVVLLCCWGVESQAAKVWIELLLDLCQSRLNCDLKTNHFVSSDFLFFFFLNA